MSHQSISKEIVQAFMYVASSRELWLELQGRYGRSNGPMVYQIQREISLVSQRDLSLTAYVMKVKKLWNELACLAPTPKCTCGRDRAQSDPYAGSSPDLERAFSMVFAVEKQRAVHVDMAESSSHMAYQLAFKENRKEGHAQEHAFTPWSEWFKSLSDKKKRGVTSRHFAANVDEKNVTAVILLSVSQLSKSKPYQFLFSQHDCILQDLVTKESLLVGTLFKKLYIFKQCSTSSPSVSMELDDISCSTSLQFEIAHASPPDPPPLRRSNRQIQKPSWLNDFVSYTSNPSLLCSSNFAYISFVASLLVLQDPKTFSEAVQHEEWREAMSTELRALEQINTWKLTPLPNGKKAIGCKWVFKTKLRADGTVERHKARLVAKGFNQGEGIDYTYNFSPVAKTITVRVFLAVVAARGWPLQQLDINNAFLHRYLEEDLYMIPPEGYNVDSGLVCKLQRSLYGLKQASRQWNAEFILKITEYGFVQSAHDHCLFTKSTPQGLMALLLYVDDILITGPSICDIQTVKAYLHALFTIKDTGDARYFLGLEIARNSIGFYVAQTKYIEDIIKDTGLEQAKAASTPFLPGLKLSTNCGALL
ncbi:UNVERIFIED_CONTAM: Retrovirus-related Pol polyprotein from transposon RE1 [Sesamum latifolium]|uniref:Retrovirus-related Pol polyprotein from transposon RE1 n=1 Tax=Sesamum latifolium TaxID=2727402 RepID=A0AAW2VXV4_9LAMI